MRFFELAAALLCAVTVSATPTQLHNQALAERDNAELEPRLLGDLLGWNGGKDECGDKWKINLCKLKGTGWFCNKDCNCEYKPPQQYCDPWVKKDCENKHNPRFVYNHEKCKCEDKGCKHGDKEKCYKEQGEWDESKCYCKPKPQCPEHVKKDCEAKKSPRYVFEKEHCKCVDKGCPHGEAEKCHKEEGTYDNEKCYCHPKPKPTCNKWDKDECLKYKQDWNESHCKCYPKQEEKCKDILRLIICKKLGKSCDGSCNCF